MLIHGDAYINLLHLCVVVFSHPELIAPLRGGRGLEFHVHAEHVPVGVHQGELKQSLHGSQGVLRGKKKGQSSEISNDPPHKTHRPEKCTKYNMLIWSP